MDRTKKEINIKPCVVEFQAFRGNDDRFIIKELVILDLLTSIVYQFMFKAPFSFNCLTTKAKITNTWLTKHFHHIGWYEGFISYSNVHSVMFHFCKQFSHIYTRGQEKKNWIQRYTQGNVFDINVGIDFKYHINNICINAKDPKHGQTHCALYNAYRLASYLEEMQGYGGEGRSGGGNGCHKYGGATRPQCQYYSILRRGNISAQSAEEDGVTTVSTITS
jgi:hypothetical protein